MRHGIRQPVLIALVLLAAAAAFALRLHATAAGAPAARPAADPGAFFGDGGIPRDAAARSFTFDPSVAGADRARIVAAVEKARPEARRLMALVDGLVTVRVGATGAPALGVAETRPGGKFVVTLDLATVSARYGARGVDRVVQHELGHVVDFAIVPADVDRRLDAGIPSGWGCDGGRAGACAAREERFAETFAKWASGDLGVDLFIGYKVPPPAITLEDWGAPLARLAGR